MKVGGFGSRLDVPLGHINAAYVRSHFDAMEVGMADGPRPDEPVRAGHGVWPAHSQSHGRAGCQGHQGLGRPAVSGEELAYRLQDQIGFILRKAHQRHVAIFASKIGDLTPPQFAALAMLAEVGETSQNQLGQLIAMDAATVKGVVDRLASRGYVTVAKDSGDKRRLLVTPTPAGRET
jgi:DNA-binding MarR family transcriptional regulator